MKKNIGKFKQWTNEKLGSSQKTETTEEFQELEQKTDLKLAGIEKLFAASNLYVKTVGKKKDSCEEKVKIMPVENLGIAMRVHGDQLGDSPYAQGLVQFGMANEKIANLQAEYVDRVKTDYIDGLESTLADLNHYKQLKKKLESRRLDYDAKLNKLQKSKKEKPELEEEMRQSKLKYEETTDDMSEKMLAIDAFETDHLKELTAFLDAQLEFFQKSYEIVSSLKENEWADITALSNSYTAKPKPRTRLTRPDSYVDTGREDDASESSNRSSLKKSKTMSVRISSPLSRSDTLSSNRSPNTPTSVSRSKSFSGSSLSPKSPVNQKAHQRKPPSPPAARKKRVIALYAFEGNGADEIPFEKGDVITVLEEIDEGWWTGEIVDQEGVTHSGMFPANYTEELDEEEAAADGMEEEPVEEEDPYEDQYEEEPEPVVVRKPPVRQSSYTAPPSRPTSMASPPRTRASMISASQPRTPPVPSRNSKPPPPIRTPSSGSSSYRSPQTPSSGYRSPLSTPNSTRPTSHYIPQDYFAGANDTSAQDEVECRECGCDDFSPNVFKKGSCNNCFHKH